METIQQDRNLTGLEKFILGKKLAGIVLSEGPASALEAAQADREAWYEASQRDRLNDIGGIVTAIPYALRTTILRNRL